MTRALRHSLVLFALGCGPEPTVPPATCAPLCDALVDGCALEGFPTREDCEAGCVEAEARGADLDGYLACVEASACDPFGLVRCEELHGVE